MRGGWGHKMVQNFVPMHTTPNFFFIQNEQKYVSNLHWQFHKKFNSGTLARLNFLTKFDLKFV